MHESFVYDIGIVLAVAAVISTLSYKLKLPSVLGYMFAGLLIGPYLPVPLFADLHRVESLSEFGVILVMFVIGLEFRIKKFFQVLPTSGVTALLEVPALFFTGLSLGYFFGWGTAQSVFLGGALAISSTMIVSKIFEEDAPDAATKRHILGVLVIQDLFAILLLTILGTFAVSRTIDFAELLPTLSQLLAVLFFAIFFGILIVPRLIRFIEKQRNTELLVVVSMGICFGAALLISKLGYSVALGAFLAGILVAESGKGHYIEYKIKPLKDIFVAIFFVSIGMTVNPVLAFEVLPKSIAITVVLIAAQFFIVFFGSVLSGAGIKKALYASLALGQIGEFAFIISAIGASANIVGPEFQAIVVSVAVLSSLTTPLLWRYADKITDTISSWLPLQFRIAVGLYEAWFNKVSEVDSKRKKSETIATTTKRLAAAVILDAILLIIVPPIILKFFPPLIQKFGYESEGYVYKVILAALILFFVSPILFGFIRSLSSLIIIYSNQIFGLQNKEQTESAKRLFSLTVWSVVSFLVSIPIFSVLRPFFKSNYLFLVIVLCFIIIIFRLWRAATDVATEVTSGSSKLLKLLTKHSYESDRVQTLDLPGLGDFKNIQIIDSKYIGETLSDINLRGRTGANVVCIQRGGKKILFPGQEETIQKHDVLQVWGTDEAKEKCVKFFNE